MTTRRHHRSVARVLLAAALATVMVLAWPAGAGALGTADQEQPAQAGSIAMPPGLAQTFTVGRTGVLDGISLTTTAPSLSRLVLQFYELKADGTPDLTRPLMPASVQVNLPPGTTVIPLAGFPVTAGQQIGLAIGLLDPVHLTASLATMSGDPYPAGQLFQVPGIYTFNPVEGVDLRFATYVTSRTATALTLKPLSKTAHHPTAFLTADGLPLPGKTVVFELHRADGSLKSTCSALTDTNGRARCSSVRWKIPVGGSLVATYAGDASYLPSTAALTR